MKKGVQRCLFGRASEEDRKRDRERIDDHFRTIRKKKSDELNFDFELCVPREGGRYVWEKVQVRPLAHISCTSVNNNNNHNHHRNDDDDDDQNISTPAQSHRQSDEEGARQTHTSMRQETLDKRTDKKCGVVSPGTTPTPNFALSQPKSRVSRKAEFDATSEKNFAGKRKRIIRSTIPAFFKNKKPRPSAT